METNNDHVAGVEVSEFEYGIQPIDAVMGALGWTNQDLVDASGWQITFKMARKARSGRRLTRKIQLRIVEAANTLAQGACAYRMEDLFNYDGR